jgi:hypothetical protein
MPEDLEVIGNVDDVSVIPTNMPNGKPINGKLLSNDPKKGVAVFELPNDDGSEPVKPKFKVGDRVRSTRDLISASGILQGKCGTVIRCSGKWVHVRLDDSQKEFPFIEDELSDGAEWIPSPLRTKSEAKVKQTPEPERDCPQFSGPNCIEQLRYPYNMKPSQLKREVRGDATYLHTSGTFIRVCIDEGRGKILIRCFGCNHLLKEIDIQEQLPR